jgi:hypothetical protein
MKAWKPVVVGIGALAVTTAALVPGFRTTRSVRLGLLPDGVTTESASAGFDRHQSAGLFVGVRTFKLDRDMQVPFAADDAVDLAYAFALGRSSGLVDPEHVVIALSGKPRKEESQRKLEALERAGARVIKAEHNEILTALQEQTAAAGRDGILIVSLATHGFVEDGIPYVLDATSDFQLTETTISLPALFEITANSKAERSLYFIDACRERLSRARGGTDPATAGISIGRMGRVHGQVIFYAAPVGGYAYDDPKAKNGVFTKAVLDGVTSCKAALDRGAITAETLQTFVEREVRGWIWTNKHRKVPAATQVSIEGSAGKMVLAQCIPPLCPPLFCSVDRVTYDGSTVTAFSQKEACRWSRDAQGPISSAKVAHLLAGNSTEVIVAATALQVFDPQGTSLWSTAVEGMRLRGFLVDDLKTRDSSLQIAALWDDERTSRSQLSVYDAQGHRLTYYDHPGRLQHFTIDRPTARHARKIVLSGIDDEAGASLGVRAPLASLTVLNSGAKVQWTGVLLPATERIARLEVGDSDNDARRDISLLTATGNVLHVDFDGRLLPGSSAKVKLTLVAAKKKHRRPRSSPR